MITYARTWQDQQMAVLQTKLEQEVTGRHQETCSQSENIMVARVTLHNMRQDRGKPVRIFGARLRGQADICKFHVKCPDCDTDVNDTDEILRDALTRDH